MPASRVARAASSNRVSSMYWKLAMKPTTSGGLVCQKRRLAAYASCAARKRL